MIWKWLSKIRKNEHPDFRLFRSTIDNIEAQTKKTVFGLDHRDNYQEIDGKLNGRIKIEDLWIPIISGQLITEIDNNRISGCSNIHNVDGKINGCIAFGNMHLPVINNEIIREVDGLTIDDCRNISSIDGTLNGAVKVKGKWLPIVMGELIYKIEGYEIIDCADIHVIDNSLNGRVRLANYAQPSEILCKIFNNQSVAKSLAEKMQGFIPIINGKIVSHVESIRILDCSSIHIIDGKINGKIRYEGLKGNWVPIISNIIYSTMVKGTIESAIFNDRDQIRKTHFATYGPTFSPGTLEIVNCDEIFNVSGELNGVVTVRNPGLYSWDQLGGSLPVLSSMLITSIEDKIIQDSCDVRNVENTLNGRVKYRNGGYTWWPVISNRLISHIENEKIYDCSNIHNIANTLNGEIGLGEKSLEERKHCVVLGELVNRNN